jgi:hypothetical protein
VYFNQNKAWCNTRTLTRWFYEVFYRMSTWNRKTRSCSSWTTVDHMALIFPIQLSKLRWSLCPLIVWLSTNQWIKVSSKH